MGERPWCCPEPRCIPVHLLKDSEVGMQPGGTFMCFGDAPEVQFVYDGIEHRNDTRMCTYTALKGLIAFQENVDDWLAIEDAYRLALRKLAAHRGTEARQLPARQLAADPKEPRDGHA